MKRYVKCASNEAWLKVKDIQLAEDLTAFDILEIIVDAIPDEVENVLTEYMESKGNLYA